MLVKMQQWIPLEILVNLDVVGLDLMTLEQKEHLCGVTAVTALIGTGLVVNQIMTEGMKTVVIYIQFSPGMTYPAVMFCHYCSLLNGECA